jgi:hypothetical protein
VRIGVNPSPSNENQRRRAYGAETALRGMNERVSGHERIGRAIARGQLNGGPYPLIRPLIRLIQTDEVLVDALLPAT